MNTGDITSILGRISSGERQALDELMPIVYEQMKIIAKNASSGEQLEQSSPTELVHEAYIRLVGNEKLAWQSRSHFFGACATVIRRLLVDEVRGRQAEKRGGSKSRIELNDHIAAENSIDLLELESALQELSQLAPRQVQLVELRYFGGLSETEAAEVLGVSRRTVSGDWAMAKAWLKQRISS
ncbi:MAG: ECF-type sigma factor [Planctomycetota bacterium]